MVAGTTTVGALRTAVRRFVRERDWERFHLPKDLAIAISVEASELLERFLWRGPAPATLSSEGPSAIAGERAEAGSYGQSLAVGLPGAFLDSVLAQLTEDEVQSPPDRTRGRCRFRERAAR